MSIVHKGIATRSLVIREWCQETQVPIQVCKEGHQPVIASGTCCTRTASGSAAGRHFGISSYSWLAPPSAQTHMRATRAQNQSIKPSSNADCCHACTWLAAHKALVLPIPPADSSLGVHAGSFQFSTTTTVSCGALPASCRSRKSLSSVGGSACDGSDAPPLHMSRCARSWVASAIVLLAGCQLTRGKCDRQRRVLCAEC